MLLFAKILGTIFFIGGWYLIIKSVFKMMFSKEYDKIRNLTYLGEFMSGLGIMIIGVITFAHSNQ